MDFRKRRECADTTACRLELQKGEKWGRPPVKTKAGSSGIVAALASGQFQSWRCPFSTVDEMDMGQSSSALG